MALVAPPPLQALKSDAKQPIYIEADSAELDDANNTTTYTGNVILTQGTLRLSGDTITIRQRSANKEGDWDHLEVIGRPARLEQEMEGKRGRYVRGRSDRIEYLKGSDLLHFIGHAVVVQGRDTFRSDRITYDRLNSLVKGGAAAKGKRRIRITIQSEKGSGNP